MTRLEARPVIRRTDVGYGFSLAGAGDAEHEEDYRFSNLDLQASSETSNGFFIYTDVDDAQMDGATFQGFGIGVHVAGSNPCSADPECDGFERGDASRWSCVRP